MKATAKGIHRALGLSGFGTSEALSGRFFFVKM